MSNHFSQNTSKSTFKLGYTLIEILVSITIISLLFLTGFAAYREYSRRQSLISAARKVQGDIRLAQQFAISSKKPAGCTTLDGYYFVVVPPNSYQISWFCDPTTGVDKTVQMPDGVTISALSPNLTPSNSILFKTLGQGTNIPALTGETVITLTQIDMGTTVNVTVTAGGEVK